MRLRNVSWLFAGIVLFIAGAWAIENQESQEVPNGAAAMNYNPNDPRNIPLTTSINLRIIGFPRVGVVTMIEGIQNETSITSSSSGLAPGSTRYPLLVLHGLFERDMRFWRDDIIANRVTRRDMEIDLQDSQGRRVLRFRIRNAWPVSFTIPPLSLDGSTRYIERMEFAYERFDIID